VQKLIEVLTHWRSGQSSTVMPPQRHSGTELLFDSIARLAASELPRRQVLKIALTGFAGAIVASLTPKQARADTCDCNGESYDSNTQCCTPSGIQERNPITNLSDCPDRVSIGDFPAPSNGCGPDGGVLTPIIPNHFGSADFFTCCNHHDECYGTCNDVKDDCDTSFLSCLTAACMGAYPPGSGLLINIVNSVCDAVASIYYGAVHNFGTDAYNAGQEARCYCCPAPDPQQPCCPQAKICGDQCCSPEESCINGSCCPQGSVCGNQCCAPGQTCVNGSCCPNASVCLDQCCSPDQFCISGNCVGCQYQCPCPSGPNAGKIFATCAECLAVCPSGLACFGYLYCIPIGSNCATCP
jgi:hypothetical protein